MQEEYKRKLDQEVQWYISSHSSTLATGSTQTMKARDDRIFNQKKALETAKQMLHQTRGEARSSEMDWDYYGVHTHSEEQSRQRGEVVSHGSGKVEERGISKRATSTPLEEEKHPHDYATFQSFSI